MGSARVRHIVLQLVDVSIRSEDRPVRRIEILKETVRERNRRLRVIRGGKKGRAADISQRSHKCQMRSDCPRITKRRIALMIKKVDAEVGIDRRLVGIRRRSSDLVQTESPEESRLIGNAMIDAHGKLVGVRGDLGRSGIRARSVRSLRLVGQGISGQDTRNRRTHRHSQRIAGSRRSAGKGRCVDSLPLRRRGHGEYLRRPEHLPESLILREIKCFASAVINMWQKKRPAVGHSKFVARKRRNPPPFHGTLVIEIIARIKRRVADKFKRAAVHIVCPRLRKDIVESSRSMPDLRRHHARTRLHFLNRVHVEVRKSRAAKFRVRRIRAVHRKHGS